MGLKCVRWGFTSAGIWCDIVKTPEDLDCWITLNTVVFTQLCFLCAVNLDEGNVLFFKGSRSLLVLGCESLAVAAPWCKELGKDQVVLFDKVFECVLISVSKGCHMR